MQKELDKIERFANKIAEQSKLPQTAAKRLTREVKVLCYCVCSNGNVQCVGAQLDYMAILCIMIHTYVINIRIIHTYLCM